MSKILVLGSLSTDFVATTDIRPNVGETVQGNSFFTTFGGKGANQAVAASRLNQNVVMLGMVGDDNFGKEILSNLSNNGIDISCVESVNNTSSGAALITIADSDNSIIYVPGANGIVNADYVSKYSSAFENTDIAVAQNEVSEESIIKMLEICDAKGIKSIVNPAPFREMPEFIIEKASFLIPNESECKLMFPNLTVEEAVKLYPNKLIVTMGSKGVYFNNGNESILVPSFKVEAVDTTGAGDTFVAGFSVGISNGLSIEEAISFANLTASMSVTKMGAQGGMPTLKALKDNKNYNKNWNENIK